MELVDITLDSYDAMMNMDSITAHLENMYTYQYNYEVESGLEEYSLITGDDYYNLIGHIIHSEKFGNRHPDMIRLDYLRYIK